MDRKEPIGPRWQFPRLTGTENYRNWARAIRIALEFDRLWHVVESNDLPNEPAKVPALQPDGTTVMVKNTNEILWEIFEDALKKRKQQHKTAIGLIRSKCSDEIAGSIDPSQKSAMKVWKFLRLSFLGVGFTTAHRLLQAMSHITLASRGGSIELYIRDIKYCRQTILDECFPLDDWVVVSCLLAGLDDRFKEFALRYTAQREGPEVHELCLALREFTHAIDGYYWPRV